MEATAHSLPTAEIIHTQMRVCNRGVGLSLFELRRRCREFFRSHSWSPEFAQPNCQHIMVLVQAWSMRKLGRAKRRSKSQEARDFQEALHRLGNWSTRRAAGIPQNERNTWGHTHRCRPAYRYRHRIHGIFNSNLANVPRRPLRYRY